MTYIAVTSFFDKQNRWMGYALASDARGGVGKITTPNLANPANHDAFETEKCFAEERFVGLFVGGIAIPHKAPDFSHKKTFEEELRSKLDRKFEDIEAGKKYSGFGLTLLKDVPTTLVVAKRNPLERSVKLFTVRKKEQKEWQAEQIHVGNQRVYTRENSRVWLGPYDGVFNVLDIRERVSPAIAQAAVEVILKESRASEHVGYKIKSTHVYFISPDEHGKIQDGRLVSLL